MQMIPLDFQEKVIYKLRSLFNRNGYTHYKMNKFEEYDLYARNKDFLISDRVLTFMDTNGRLMALKPDVTLSIIKNTKDFSGHLQRLYYDENVYRVSKGTNSFKEIKQVGLECIGQIDDFAMIEVLTIACQSIRMISFDSVLEISHLGFLSDLLNKIGIPKNKKALVLKCIEEKNSHDMYSICLDCGISPEKADLLNRICSLSGDAKIVLPKIIEISSSLLDCSELTKLLQYILIAHTVLNDFCIRFDFSVVADLHYYNGLVFKGYVSGIPAAVISGGRYDNLMQEMSRKSGAIGFAIYMDALERMEYQKKVFDADYLITYDASSTLPFVFHKATQLREKGHSVIVEKAEKTQLRCRKYIRINGDEVTEIEDNA